MAHGLVERFGAEVPEALEDLVTLPGVGRKTANVVRSVAFGLPGLPVDTHVGRLSRRLGLTSAQDPVVVEQDLNTLVDPNERGAFSLRLILHGRAVCVARAPDAPSACSPTSARRRQPSQVSGLRSAASSRALSAQRSGQVVENPLVAATGWPLTAPAGGPHNGSRTVRSRRRIGSPRTISASLSQIGADFGRSEVVKCRSEPVPATWFRRAVPGIRRPARSTDGALLGAVGASARPRRAPHEVAPSRVDGATRGATIHPW